MLMKYLLKIIIFLLKGVIIKSLQCHMKLKNENGTAYTLQTFEGCSTWQNVVTTHNYAAPRKQNNNHTYYIIV